MTYNAPNSLDIEGKKYFSKDSPLRNGEEKCSELKSFLVAIAQKWINLKVSRSDVENYSGAANAKHLAVYRQALNIKEESHVCQNSRTNI